MPLFNSCSNLFNSEDINDESDDEVVIEDKVIFRLSEISTYDSSDALYGYYILDYDSSNNKIRQSDYNGSGVLIGYYVYEYDSNNNQIKDSYYAESDVLIQYVVNEYDSSNNLTRQSVYSRSDV